MRRALLLIPFLAACQGPSRFTVTEGNVTMSAEQFGHVGGQNYSHLTRSKTGALAITSRSNMERSFTDATQAVTTVAGGIIMAGVSKAKDAGDAAVAISAQKASAAKAKIAADQAVQLGAQGVEKVKLITPPQ